MISHDVFMPIKDLTILWISKPEWSKIIDSINDADYHLLRNMQNDVFGRPEDRIVCWLVHIELYGRHLSFKYFYQFYYHFWYKNLFSSKNLKCLLTQFSLFF